MPAQKIVEILTESKEPIKIRKLHALLKDSGFNISCRVMRKIYAANPLVISNSKGVYLAKTQEEVDAFCKTEKKRGISIWLRARAAKREFIKNHKAKEVPIVYSYNEKGQKMFV